MQSLLYVKGSDGTANASQMTVTTLRNALATTILVNTVTGAPAGGFFGSMGTPHTFVDPVTGETITIISDATAVDFAGHISAGTVIIDAISPGYTDAGSKVGDIVVIRPVTEWTNNIYNVLNQSFNDNGSFKADSIVDATPFADLVDPVLRAAEQQVFDYVAGGGVQLAGLGYGSTLTASMSAGTCYINGNRQPIAAVATRTYTANKDTYVDALYNAGGAATIVYTEVANNAASSALAANSVRLGIVVSGANIAAATSINQGSPLAALPIASSIPYITTDSLGNLICPRDAQRQTLGYTERVAGQSAIGAITDITGMSMAVKIPSNCYWIFLEAGSSVSDGTAGTTITYQITDGSNVAQAERSTIVVSANVLAIQFITAKRRIPVTPGSTYTFKLRMAGGSSVVNQGNNAARASTLQATRA